MLLRKSISITIIILGILTLAGCWDYKEVKQISIVSGLAIDKGKNGSYIATIEIIVPKSKGTGTTIESKIIGSDGITIFDAIRNAIMRTGKKLYWGHAKIIILSEDIAKKGFVPILDWIHRDAEVREDMFLLISRNKTAREIFATKPNTHDIIAFQIADLIEQNKYIPKFPSTDIWDFLSALSAKGMTAVVPTIKTVKYRKDEKLPQVYGCAAFNKDKMVGWLDGNGTRNFLFIQGKVSNGLIPLEVKYQGKKTKITLEIFSLNTDLKASLKKNKPEINIKSKVDVSLAEIEGTTDFVSNEKARKKLEKDAGKFISSQIQDTIHKVQKDYNADIFGFGKVIKKQMPDKWKKLEPKWNKEFSKLKTKVSIEVKISESATTSKPIKVGD